MSFLKFIIYLGMFALNITLSYVMLWYLAGTFDLDFIKQPTWRQYWGISMVVSLFMGPLLVNKTDKDDGTEVMDKFLKNQAIITISMGVLYLLSLLINWVL